MINHNKHAAGWVAAIIIVLALAVPAAAGATPTRLVFASHFGGNVDKTQVERPGSTRQERDVCTISSKDVCQPGTRGPEPGAFTFPYGVAVGPDGSVYVADTNNARIEKFDSDGRFVMMFGWNVNKTRVAEGAPQSQRNVCSVAEENTGAQCGAGEKGTGLAEQLSTPSSIAVGGSGQIYVMNYGYHRVDEYGENGAFVLAIGKKVNKSAITTHPNLCLAAESTECGAGELSAAGSTEQAAFKPIEEGNVLTVGENDGLLYVGDEGRIQKFRANGEGAGEIPLTGLPSTGKATGVAVDTLGDVFVADSGVGGVYMYEATTGQLNSQVIGPTTTKVKGLSIDAYGRLGIIEQEGSTSHGFLYSASGEKISEFNSPTGVLAGVPKALAFAHSSSDELYVAATTTQEIEAYELGLEVHTCAPPAGEVLATSARLCGEVNPNGLPTRAFFVYSPLGRSANSYTPIAFEGEGTTATPFYWSLTGLIPNESYEYEALAEAEVGGKKASGAGEPAQSFKTQAVPPAIQSAPTASYLYSDAAVLSASVNPENARTEYYLEYGACEPVANCAVDTPVEASSAYGTVGLTAEVKSLSPSTTYHDRLIAINEYGTKVEGPEGSFTTAPTPTPRATTGLPSEVTTTSAVVSGSVEPDGQAGLYMFELGALAGSSTAYTVVDQGAISPSSNTVTESLTVSGLQPGTVYVYRVRFENGYGEAQGAEVTFTTPGLPAQLAPPQAIAQLEAPRICFPSSCVQPKAKCKPGYRRSQRGGCMKHQKAHVRRKASSRARRHRRKGALRGRKR